MSSTEKIVSPGVFTQENNLSYVQKGVSEIGPLFVGRTKTGPAFQPIQTSKYKDDWNLTFGGKSSDYRLPYAAEEYHRNGGALTTVRVLGSSPLSYEKAVEISSGSVLLAVIRPTSLAGGTVFA